MPFKALFSPERCLTSRSLVRPFDSFDHRDVVQQARLFEFFQIANNHVGFLRRIRSVLIDQQFQIAIPLKHGVFVIDFDRFERFDDKIQFLLLVETVEEFLRRQRFAFARPNFDVLLAFRC